MAFTTEKTYTQSGSTNKDFIVTFPFLASTDVKVQKNGTTQATSAYSITGTTVTFDTAPANDDVIRLFRDTDIDKTKVTFQTGASIRAQDLNDTATQLLYSAQEQEQASTTASGTGLALTTGTKNNIIVNSATDWVLATGAAAANLAPSSIVTAKIANGNVTKEKLDGDAVDGTKIEDNSIDSEHYVNGSIDTEHIQDLQVTTGKIADQAITQAKISNAVIFTPVGTVIWYAGSTAPTGYLKCNGDAIANGTGTTQSITADFSALYAVVGANLPDLRGEFIRGWDDGKGTDSGRAIRSAQGDANKQHNHLVTDPGHHHTYVDQINANEGYRPWKAGDNDCGQQSKDTGDEVTGISIQNDGGPEARPRNIALLACIKY